jgi:hypothetical protein
MTDHRRTTSAFLAAFLALAGLVPGTALAAGAKPSEAQQRYQEERANCLRGQTNQDRATCLKEAGAAYGEARRGALNNSGGPNFSQNATERCKAQPAADRDACVQRILGAGSTTGSVKGGGLIRETETVVK